jgi:hypothetical protein
MTRGKGGAADVADLRRWEPLPETADELCEVAHDLGVDPTTHVYLSGAATETKVNQLSERVLSQSTRSFTSLPMVQWLVR